MVLNLSIANNCLVLFILFLHISKEYLVVHVNQLYDWYLKISITKQKSQRRDALPIRDFQQGHIFFSRCFGLGKFASKSYETSN